jgi:phosphate butyryltransferase
MDAVNMAVEEGIVHTAWLFGDLRSLPESCRRYPDSYRQTDLGAASSSLEKEAAREAVASVARGDCQMLMKGRINTAVFVKAMLNKRSGIGTGRRLSLVSIFELPDLDRLIFLTDPGINPELFPGDDAKASVDIVSNAIGVARSMGIACPRVALLEANEVPSRSIPTTLYESKLSHMTWENAVVDGPVSYDLALYEEAAKKKGVKPSPVIGKADILVVPHISGGNFLYKAWTKTMAAEVANVVIGASVPVILTSRSDGDMVKFLSMCACVLYSQHFAAQSRSSIGCR